MLLLYSKLDFQAIFANTHQLLQEDALSHHFVEEDTYKKIKKCLAIYFFYIKDHVMCET